jgi:hypothetical protein
LKEVRIAKRDGETFEIDEEGVDQDKEEEENNFK